MGRISLHIGPGRMARLARESANDAIAPVNDQMGNSEDINLKVSLATAE